MIPNEEAQYYYKYEKYNEDEGLKLEGNEDYYRYIGDCNRITNSKSSRPTKGLKEACNIWYSVEGISFTCILQENACSKENTCLLRDSNSGLQVHCLSLNQ